MEHALHAHGPVADSWGVPERANGVIQLVNLPEGWNSACLIPWVPESRVLAPIAMIEHERLRYSTELMGTVNGKFARIPYADYLTGDPPVLHVSSLRH